MRKSLTSERKHEGFFWNIMELFCILIEVGVTWLYAFAKCIKLHTKKNRLDFMSIKKEIFKYYSKRVYIIEVIRSQFYTCLRKCIYPFNNNLLSATIFQGIPGGLVVKNLPASTGDVGLILGLGRSPGEGNGNPLQYSCLGNPMDRQT